MLVTRYGETGRVPESKSRVDELSHYHLVCVAMRERGNTDADTSAVLEHGQKRGIYVGFTGPTTRAFLLALPHGQAAIEQAQALFVQETRTANDILAFWQTRWAQPRDRRLTVIQASSSPATQD
jgi:hypothetical protein